MAPTGRVRVSFNPRALSVDVKDRIIRLRKTLTRKGIDAGAETIAAPGGGRRSGAGSLDDLADPGPPRLCHPQPQKRRLLGVDVHADQRNHRWQAESPPLGVGRWRRGGDLEHPRRPFPTLPGHRCPVDAATWVASFRTE